jgi:hypothetical protein
MELVVNEDHYSGQSTLHRVLKCCSETLQVIQSNASWNMTLCEQSALSQVIAMI